MQAIILAGGKGSRLRPYTTILPKPLMPIGDHPILEIVIRQLKQSGFSDIIIAVGSQRELIEAFFGKGEKWGVKISYSSEDKPLGTAAPISIIESLEDNFLVMNGDILTTLDYRDLFSTHESSGSLCTISVFKKQVKIDLGVLDITPEGRVVDYIEKPTKQYDVSMGIYAFNRKIVEHIPRNEYFDFPDLILKMIANKLPVNSYSFGGRWLDIGRVDDYTVAVEEFESNRSEFLKENA